MESKMIRQVDDLGRIAIPKTIREELNILMGDRIKITTTEEGILLSKYVLGVGHGEDNIFLLSVGEYEEYKYVIPDCKTFWWLRTPGSLSYNASYVYSDGGVCHCGGNVIDISCGIRPALKSDIFKIVGKEYVINDFPFTCIGGGLGIATVPISFNKFDDESNDYEESLIREWLLDWAEKLVWNKQYVPETI